VGIVPRMSAGLIKIHGKRHETKRENGGSKNARQKWGAVGIIQAPSGTEPPPRKKVIQQIEGRGRTQRTEEGEIKDSRSTRNTRSGKDRGNKRGWKRQKYSGGSQGGNAKKGGN